MRRRRTKKQQKKEKKKKKKKQKKKDFKVQGVTLYSFVFYSAEYALSRFRFDRFPKHLAAS
jgi:hypothetical protein